MGKIISATAPCSWGVWYADGRPSGTPYNVFLDQAAECGYKSLEMGPDGYLPTDIVQLKEELDKRGLTICAGTACYTFDKFETFADFRDPVTALCKRLNSFDAKYLVVMDESDVGRFSEKKEHYSGGTWEKYFRMFKEMGEYTLNSFGVETVFHPHIKSLVETEDEICRMMDFCNLNLCFDIGHHAYVNGGGSVLDFIENYKERIVYLHFKNVDGAILKKVQEEHLDSDTAFSLDVMCRLDEGIVDYKALKTLLDKINFEGIGVVEQDVPNATADEAFELSRHNLKYLKDIGMV